MNYFEKIRELYSNVEIKESLAVTSPLFKVAFIAGEHHKVRKFDTFDGMYQFLKEIKTDWEVSYVWSCIDEDQENDVRLLREYNKEQEVIKFVRSGADASIDLTFGVSSSSSQGIKDHILLYFQEGDGIEYTRALRQSMNKESPFFYGGSSYTIRLRDMFYLNMIPFFFMPPIRWIKILVPISGYKEAVEFMKKYEKGEL